MTDANRDIATAVAREAGKLQAFIKKRVRSAADAEDILQEVFFEFVQAYRLPESIEQVSSWLYRVARNRIIDRFRRQTPEQRSDVFRSGEDDGNDDNLSLELPSPDAGPEAEAARVTILDALQAALNELPANQRDVFIAHEIEGLSFESLARRDGISVNTLLSRKRYAVIYLRARLQTLYDDLD